ncbi:MAG: CHRD domain-containing protein [Bacillati bacterium ANGP1]|uniref:CHRD domain-containing protein n=1 Tax=Candidatus Segetimicrobium genomatis TaxID=2569760 RepID=A0A537K4J2_9BACT|nr:MAG: CHRD domain-containing protein [Terrabacteria group bacterium ANGP1]
MRRYAMAVAVLLIALLVQRGGANGHGREFEAFMTGDQEVPPVATEMLGSVGIRFNDDFTAAKFTLTVKDGVRVTQAHIHCGAQGTNGPIVVFFAGPHAPGWDVDGKWIDHAQFTDANIVNTACGATLDALAQSMEAGNTYANVHTVAHPGGEIRGQITSK